MLKRFPDLPVQIYGSLVALDYSLPELIRADRLTRHEAG
jgi:hypothetical protein